MAFRSARWIAMTFLILGMLAWSSSVMAQNNKPLVQVNGTTITERDLQLQFLTRNIPAEQQLELRESFLNDLIEQRLIQEYLQEEKVQVNKVRVEESLSRVYKIIREADRDPVEVLERLGLNEQMLRDELMLPLAWQVHLEEKVSSDKLREFYVQQGRYRQFDGTKLHLRQIFLKLRTADAVDEMVERMNQIAQQISDGKIDFGDAARKYSEAPTAAQGGDLGFVPYEGVMPLSITGPAFALQKGELSEPFVSPFGVHLIQVVDEKPGDLSLEDVRTEVWNAMSESVWNDIVSHRRDEADIEWIK
ncbi:peptidylprolyl isomerase [Polystyrenella longa]|nr:peptidylprolyl isomerase [Polystyrenella longa]